MGLFDRILKGRGYVKYEDVAKMLQMKDVPHWVGSAADAERYTIPDYALYTNQSELYQRLAWVNIAINIVAGAAAMGNMQVYKRKGEDREAVLNHDFEKLLQHPNPSMSRYEFLFATTAYYKLTGNSYWWINSFAKGGQPRELWIVPSNKIVPIPDKKSYLSHYEYNAGTGEIVNIPVNEIVHFKSFHPNNMFVGLSPIESIAVDAEGELKMSEWNTRLFADNNGRLPSILSFADTINDTDYAKIKYDIKQATKLRDMLILRGVGAGGLSWLQNTASPKDLEFMKGREFNMQMIYNLFAPGLVSMLTPNATEANAKTAKATFTEYSVWPAMTLIHEKVTNDIMPLYGEDMFCEFDDIRVTDRTLELSEQQEYAKTHTINEIRQKYYEDDALEDERGEMLPAQISPTTAIEEDEPEAPVIQPVPEVIEQPAVEDIEDAEDELVKWHRKATRAIKDGKSADVKFKSQVIPLADQIKIKGMLEACKSKEDVDRVFDGYKEPGDNRLPTLVKALTEVKEEMVKQETKDEKPV